MHVELDAAISDQPAPALLLHHMLGRRLEILAVEARRVGGNLAAAKNVGKAVAERAKAKGITKVVFDRGGYIYHGRVKALADAAREAGLKF